MEKLLFLLKFLIILSVPKINIPKYEETRFLCFLSSDLRFAFLTVGETSKKGSKKKFFFFCFPTLVEQMGAGI